CARKGYEDDYGYYYTFDYW
nr:immunoglobulin heavy chain junction region [Macaca mulatta]MOX14693.1 immunoglobulin heavy chain junction region [Macaca mulatta]MOX15358.1 immunoglobulin heavy chain junction region [Macaca mulatta]